MTAYRDRLRRLTISDGRYLEEVMGGREATVGDPPGNCLDPTTRALVRVAALVALDGPGSAFDGAVTSALAAGASADDIVDALIAVGPTVGSALLVSAAPKVAMALGYDVGADLELLDPEPYRS
jgi:alkylhydroperoxidase/carboxymuconolactone decarboxylase family protein YurZ